MSEAREVRPLNWAGRSSETIAAMYESDAAAAELVDEPSDAARGYLDTACRAEEREWLLDRELGDRVVVSDAGEEGTA